MRGDEEMLVGGVHLPASMEAALPGHRLQGGSPFKLLVRSGKHLNITTMQPADILLSDVAWALGHLGRFTGHAPGFYSVAEHSVLCGELARECGASPSQVLAVLMHDAAEAYMGDVARPVKCRIGEWYPTAEEALMRVVATRFHLAMPLATAVDPADDWHFVKPCDNGLLAKELHEFWPNHGALVHVAIPPEVVRSRAKIRFLAPKMAARGWLMAVREVAGSGEDITEATRALVSLA